MLQQGRSKCFKCGPLTYNKAIKPLTLEIAAFYSTLPILFQLFLFVFPQTIKPAKKLAFPWQTLFRRF